MMPARRLVLIAVATIGVSSCASFPFGDCKQETPNASVTVPDSFVVAFETSRGRFDVMARKAWAPIGVGRLYELVQSRHFDDARFFRVIKGFAAQFGLAGDPKVNDAWKRRCIADEPVHHANTRGSLSYGSGGPGTRSVQLFINLADNKTLDSSGFAPIAEVVSGMSVVDSLYSGYGDAAPRSGPQYGLEGPRQDSIMAQGTAYLMRGWPKLDYIKTARVAREWK